MNISAWSIRNPVPAILLFALLCILGFRSFGMLGIQNFPDIELPTITIKASLEGAAPAQLETEVARKIEDSVASLGGIEHIRTTLTDGSATIKVEFNLEKDSEIALNEVRNAIDSVRADLPADMTDPVISKATTSGSPIATFAVESDLLDEQSLSWFVDNDIGKALLAVKGVGRVSRLGGVNREVHVDLDPSRMASLGITAADISSRLRQTQKDSSGGRGDVGSGVQSVRTIAAANSIDDIRSLEISTTNGKRIRLDEIANTTDNNAERTSYAYLNGKTVVGFQITRSTGASELGVVQDARVALKKLLANHPHIKVVEAYNSVDAVQESFDGSMQLLWEGALLAVIVVWWFLRDGRATLISAAALPLSIIPTFGAIYYFGFTLNTLTLLSLALIVGVLVDDAIVEIENIVRHLRMGKSPYQAAIDAADEIGMAVIATTFALVAVFLPTAFMGGISGKFFKQFGWTAAIAILFSLLVARLITPMMAAYLLKPLPEDHKESPIMARYLSWASWCLKHRLTTGLLAIAFFVGSLSLVPLLPKGFLPSADRGQTTINLELAPGSALDDTRKMAEQAREVLKQIPEVTSVFTSVGSSSSFGALGSKTSTDTRKASLSVTLLPRSERSRKQKDIESDIRNLLKNIPGVRASVGLGESGEKLQIVLAGEDSNMLTKTGSAVERDLRTLAGLGNISSTASLARPEIHITPDYERAADLGVTTTAMSDSVRIATSGDFEFNLPKLNLPQRQIPIRVRLDKEFRQDLNSIEQLRIASREGQVPLASVASLSMGSGPAEVERLDRERFITINVELNGRELNKVFNEAQALPSLQTLPPGISSPPTGDNERMKDLFGNFGSAMLIGVFCIYIVLVLLFHDFMQPITILAALPLSLGGAFLGLLLTGSALSMPSIIGVLMLMGIVTKNSILLVEYASVARRERGMSRYDALMDACHKRAQPIVMTTIAMSAGMLPIALGWSAEPSFRSPMAIAVIGGVITSTALSLLVIPVVFTYVDDLLEMIKSLINRMAFVSDIHMPSAPAVPAVTTSGINSVVSSADFSDVLEEPVTTSSSNTNSTNVNSTNVNSTKAKTKPKTGAKLKQVK